MGGDALGLDGAVVSMHLTFDSSTPYTNRFGFPAIVATSGTLTVSGASVAANNGNFAMPGVAFYPTFAGTFSEPGGIMQKVMLGTGWLEMYTSTTPTASGNLATVGGIPLLSDFGPTTTAGDRHTGFDGTRYNQSNGFVTATAPSSVPEPAFYGVTASAACLFLVATRRRSRRS